MGKLHRVTFHVSTETEKKETLHRSLAFDTYAYRCAGCGQLTHSRILASALRSYDSAQLLWCICPCGQPTCIEAIAPNNTLQFPAGMEFRPSQDWPEDVNKLFAEAAMAYSAGAYTASSIVCRKLLMNASVENNAPEGKSFEFYVDYLASNVLTSPTYVKPLDAIRKIGNTATHKIAFVSMDDARRSMRITTMFLDAIYTVPNL